MWLLSEEEMRDYFEAQIPEAKRNELFDLLTIDYMTELLMAAKAQLKDVVVKLRRYDGGITEWDNNGKWFVIFEMPLEDYESLLKEAGL